jgi:hypothetical protein
MYLGDFLEVLVKARKRRGRGRRSRRLESSMTVWR